MNQHPATMINVPPIRDPFEDARKDHMLLQQDNATLQQQLAEAMTLNSRLAADVDARGREIERLTASAVERDKKMLWLQGFSSRLITRLDTIQEQIIKAKHEAAAEAVQLGLVGNETPEERSAADQVRGIIERTQPLLPGTPFGGTEEN